MNGTVRMISFSPILALLELLLGALLLIDAIGLSGAVIIVFGAVLVLAGLWRLLRYLRRTKEEAPFPGTWPPAPGLYFSAYARSSTRNGSWTPQVHSRSCTAS